MSNVGIGNTVRLATSVVGASGQRLPGMESLLARWKSSDTTIATVSVTGVVKGLHAGIVTISAFAGRQTASSTVTVGTGRTGTTGHTPQPTPAPTDSASTSSSDAATPATTGVAILVPE